MVWEFLTWNSKNSHQMSDHLAKLLLVHDCLHVIDQANLQYNLRRRGA